jgi:hypothetical protein
MNKSAIKGRTLKPTTLIVTFYLLLFTFSSNAQGIGISQTGTPVNPSALLDIDGNDQGLLIPRVLLTSTTDATTITNGNVISLLIYNAATLADVVPGYYYWDGSVWKTLDGPVDDGSAGYYEVDAITNITHTVGTSNVNSMVITTADAGNYRTEAVLDFTSGGGSIVSSAVADHNALRAEIAALTQTSTHAVGFLNESIGPNSVIDVVGAASLSGNIDYDAGGDPDAIFVIRVTTTITAAASATYTLSNGAQACNIFWLAGTTVAITGAGNVVGTYTSGTTGAAAALSVINGRLLALAGTIVLTTVSEFTVPTGSSALTMGVLNTFIVFSNLGAVTATALSPINFTGDVGTGTAAGNTGWAGLNGDTYFGAGALGFVGSFVMALDGIPIESTRINATGSSVSFLGKTITTTAGGIISIMSDITLGTMTTGDRNIFSLRLN